MPNRDEQIRELLERWKKEVDEYRKLGNPKTAEGMLATIAFYSHIDPILALLKK